MKKVTIKKIHDLIILLKDSEFKLPKNLEEYIYELNPHYQPLRYPDIPYKGPVFRYDKEMAQYHFNKTKTLFLWLTRKLISKN